MPKSKTPIVSSEVLENKNISLCLLSLNPINEEKVKVNWVENAGEDCVYLVNK